MLDDNPHKFLYNFFKFLEKKKGTKTPLSAKLLYAPEELTDEDFDPGGDYDLSMVSPSSLPDGLTIQGYLYLGMSETPTLPNRLKVTGGLNLMYSKLTSIPNNLKVGGDFTVRNTPLAEKYSKEEIRKMIEDKGGYVKGDIYV